MTNHAISDEIEVLAAVSAFNRAFADNDPEEYFRHIADEITVFTPSNPYRVEGIVADRAEFEFGVRSQRSLVNHFQQMQTKIQVLGEVAVVTYFSRGSYGPDGSAVVTNNKETDILVRRNDGWKVLHIHVSSTT